MQKNSLWWSFPMEIELIWCLNEAINSGTKIRSPCSTLLPYGNSPDFWTTRFWCSTCMVLPLSSNSSTNTTCGNKKSTSLKTNGGIPRMMVGKRWTPLKYGHFWYISMLDFWGVKMKTQLNWNYFFFGCAKCSYSYGQFLGIQPRQGKLRKLKASLSHDGSMQRLVYLPTMGNPQPSFLGVITHILGVKNLHFSWFWGPKVH